MLFFVMMTEFVNLSFNLTRQTTVFLSPLTAKEVSDLNVTASVFCRKITKNSHFGIKCVRVLEYEGSGTTRSLE